MTKQYKLLKWYPSLPKDWEAGTVVEKLYQKYFAETSYGESCVLAVEVENNPEFWEEIVEKEYEILKVKGNNTRKIKSYDNRQEIGNRTYDFSIHSVRRLSDSEVFTVGDTVELKKEKPYYGCGLSYKIEQFSILKNNKIEVDFKDCGSCPLNGIQHYKEPLFTTDDGVDICLGDEYFFVSPQDHHKIRRMTATARHKNKYGLAYFKHKKNAIEWRAKNIKQYTLQDVEDALKKVGRPVCPQGSPTVRLTIHNVLDKLKEK